MIRIAASTASAGTASPALSIRVWGFPGVIHQGFTATHGTFRTERTIADETGMVANLAFGADDAATTMKAVIE